MEDALSRGYDAIMDVLREDLSRYFARRRFGTRIAKWFHFVTILDNSCPEVDSSYWRKDLTLATECTIDSHIWRKAKKKKRFELLFASMLRGLREAAKTKRKSIDVGRLILAFEKFGESRGITNVDIYQKGVGPSQRSRKRKKPEEYLIEIQFKLSNREFGTEQEREKLFQIERRIMDGLSGFKGAYCDGNEIGGGYYSVVLIAKQYEEAVRHVEKYVAAHEFTPGSRVTVRALHKELARSKRVEFSPKKGSGTRREKK